MTELWLDGRQVERELHLEYGNNMPFARLCKVPSTIPFVTGDVEDAQWRQLAVNHYIDDTLEGIRQDCVRIRSRNDGMHWSAEERDRIQA